jgi:hypothetical protein
MSRTEVPDLKRIASEPWLDGHIFNESEMGRSWECKEQYAQKHWTPATLSEKVRWLATHPAFRACANPILEEGHEVLP